jgi:DNA-binding NtrC family response regulator
MCPRAQVALLRFLQEREYRPIGGTLIRGANVRVIASANADLEASAVHGTFRQDLLFRLNVLPLHLPPLRGRGDDVITLAHAFLRRFSRQYGQPLKMLDADSLLFLKRHTWPGNVRELENLIHRQFLLSDGPMLRLTPDAPPAERDESTFQEAKARAIAAFERQYIATLLVRTQGNISMAARLSGKERSRLCKLIKKYGLDRASFAGHSSVARTA